MTRLEEGEIARAYQEACRAEIEALKPGNVHVFSDGHRMTADQFRSSARVSAPFVAAASRTVGERILEAVRATRQALGINTNLGIVLLCAPLARAAERSGSLHENLRNVLAALTVADARDAFEAIVLASPAGLGEAPAHDVREVPSVTLLEAMRAAADRDTIARQYVGDFVDVFDIGMTAHRQAEEHGEGGMWPVVHTYMAFLASLPDSHVARKFGADLAREICDEAAEALARLGAAEGEDERIRLLSAFDASLKERNINPGTSADLTVASVFALKLVSSRR
ncbi:triphosphoribosyl-dephospho-CoA synthase [Aquamicrobium sp. LC103]|uniref:triphosphoribosyl-dephospho-CoA synthase n=1 Tax=Aquamicrobium sp. LC103 TaxID=1120658 RepID=UPI00063E7F2E|nr:triphosphoribosyl-dephospho-CoA synthase [Aquamicrobium sp. LC103]TKT69355.1 triphosphoribosyl-dephospho-CoA synthase [Aquamicrobium sp. LC103]